MTDQATGLSAKHTGGRVFKHKTLAGSYQLQQGKIENHLGPIFFLSKI